MDFSLPRKGRGSSSHGHEPPFHSKMPVTVEQRDSGVLGGKLVTLDTAEGEPRKNKLYTFLMTSETGNSMAKG